MEDLGELEGVGAFVDEQIATNEADHASVSRGLDVVGEDAVSDLESKLAACLIEGGQLRDDSRRPLELFALKGEHRASAVQHLQVLPRH